MKNGILLLLAVCAAVASPAFGNQSGLTYTNSYRWHGFGLYGDEVTHAGVDVTIEGIDVSTVSHVQKDDDLKKWDTVLGYKLPIDGLDVGVGYGYFLLPGMDAQEMSVTAAVPGAISPRYTLAHIIPDNADSGQMHIFGVDIPWGDICDPNAISGLLSAEVTFNDGVNPYSDILIRDFTHVLIGLQANLPVGDLIFQPGVYYQHTFEPLIEPDKNECWFSLGLMRRF